VTAGAIDTHVHFINPDQFEVALSNGTTTLIGGGAGPGAGSRATTATPGPWHIESMIQSLEDAPINVGLTGKGHAAARGPLAEQVKEESIGMIFHEDWGAPTSYINHPLRVADE